jgi:chromodomain-helicase-DNA-binding protein 4
MDQEGLNVGPWLVCVPLSTVRNWEREFALWAPNLDVVVYSGNAESRQLIRDHEFFSCKSHPDLSLHEQRAQQQQQQPQDLQNDEGDSKNVVVTTAMPPLRRVVRVGSNIPVKFNVLLTSYEMILADYALLSPIPWQVSLVAPLLCCCLLRRYCMLMYKLFSGLMRMLNIRRY